MTNEATQQEFKRLTSILAQVSHYMDSFQADLFYDLPNLWTAYQSGEFIPIIVTKNHADTITRYEDCLREDGIVNPTYQQSIDYAKRTLGVDMVIEIRPDVVSVSDLKLSHDTNLWIDNMKSTMKIFKLGSLELK